MEKKSECPDDNIYYNIVVTNPVTASNSINIEYTENRVQSILDNPCEYFLSIVRFAVSGVTVPLFVCPVTPPSLLTTPFSVTLSFSGTDFQTFLIYQPRDLSSVPSSPFGEYYYIFDYQHFIDMINRALLTSFTALKLAFPLAPPTEAPYFVYNAETQLISLFAQQLYAGLATISIYINIRLEKYLTAIENIFLGSNTLNGKDVQFLVKDNKNNTPASPAAYYEMKQQFNMLYLWNSFQKIVFTTGTIPVKYEYIPSQPLNNPANPSSTPEGANTFRAILTDFQPSQEGAGDVRSNFIYFPQGPYRLVDLNSKTPLNKFDIQVFWEDDTQALRPLQIIPGGSMNVKFLFVKRKLYKSNHIN